MKKRNHFIAIMLSVFLSLFAIGCGGANGNGNGAGSKELTVYVSKAGYGTAWLDQFKAGFKKETGITVTIKEKMNLSSTLTQNLDLLKDGTSTKNMDLADIYFTGVANWLKYTNYGQCVLEPLDELDFVKNGKLNGDVKAWGSRNNGKDGEHLYVLHPNMAMETFVYNKNYLNKIESYGEYTKGVWPTSWQGLLDLCTQLVVNMNSKIDGKQVVPYSVYLADSFDTQKLYETLFAQGNGGQDYYNYFNEEVDTKLPDQDDHDAFVNDSFANAMYAIEQFLRVDEKNGEKPKYFKSYNSDAYAYEGFLNGESLFCWHGSFFETEAKDSIENFNEIGDAYSIGVVPAISGNEKSRTINLNFPQEFITVPAAAKNKENAMNFLNYVYKEENLIKIVKAMNAIPAIEHTYTESEKNELTRWGKEVVSTFEKFSNTANYANGISFRKSSSELYRDGFLNALNRNSSGGDLYFPTSLINDSETYKKGSVEAYKTLLEELYSGVQFKWNDEWAERYGVD